MDGLIWTKVTVAPAATVWVDSIEVTVAMPESTTMDLTLQDFDAEPEFTTSVLTLTTAGVDSGRRNKGPVPVDMERFGHDHGNIPVNAADKDMFARTRRDVTLPGAVHLYGNDIVAGLEPVGDIIGKTGITPFVLPYRVPLTYTDVTMNDPSNWIKKRLLAAMACWSTVKCLRYHPTNGATAFPALKYGISNEWGRLTADQPAGLAAAAAVATATSFLMNIQPVFKFKTVRTLGGEYCWAIRAVTTPQNSIIKPVCALRIINFIEYLLLCIIYCAPNDIAY